MLGRLQIQQNHLLPTGGIEFTSCPEGCLRLRFKPSSTRMLLFVAKSPPDCRRIHILGNRFNSFSTMAGYAGSSAVVLPGSTSDKTLTSLQRYNQNCEESFTAENSSTTRRHGCCLDHAHAFIAFVRTQNEPSCRHINFPEL